MSWRIRLAAWLLNERAVLNGNNGETLIFFDMDCLDIELINGMVEPAPNLAPITFIPVSPRQNKTVRDSIIAVMNPKRH
jgi:hypothetical protein